MSVLGGLLDKIRGKRQERFTSTAEQYDDCVRKLAAGAEVDLDHLSQLLDELDKSDSDLESDVADKQRRIEARSELDRISQLSKDLPPKRAKIAKLQEELASFIAAKKPVIQALADEIKMLQLECDRSAFVENELLTIGIPLALQNRKDALAKRQRTLSEKQDRYRDMTEQAKRNVDAAKVRLVDVEQRLSKATVGYDKEIISQEAEGLRKRIDAFEQQIQNWQPLKAEIETEQAAINEESSEIRRALMAP
jgi:predicted  nucleic acid-binding Zn-ribbon protein